MLLHGAGFRLRKTLRFDVISGFFGNTLKLNYTQVGTSAFVATDTDNKYPLPAKLLTH